MNLCGECGTYFFGIGGEVRWVTLRVRGAGEDPDVGMVYFVPDNSGEYPVGGEGFALREHDFAHEFKVCSIFWHIPYPTMVRLRDDLHVARGLRVNIEKGEESIVFIYFICRYFSADNLAKDAVLHGGGSITDIQ